MARSWRAAEQTPRFWPSTEYAIIRPFADIPAPSTKYRRHFRAIRVVVPVRGHRDAGARAMELAAGGRMLTRRVVPSVRSRIKTSATPFVSRATERFEARDVKMT